MLNKEKGLQLFLYMALVLLHSIGGCLDVLSYCADHLLNLKWGSMEDISYYGTFCFKIL